MIRGWRQENGDDDDDDDDADDDDDDDDDDNEPLNGAMERNRIYHWVQWSLTGAMRIFTNQQET